MSTFKKNSNNRRNHSNAKGHSGVAAVPALASQSGRLKASSNVQRNGVGKQAAVVQAKFVVGESHDPYELEADAVADKVTAGQAVREISSIPASGLGTVSRKIEDQPAVDSSLSAELVQARCETCGGPMSSNADNSDQKQSDSGESTSVQLKACSSCAANAENEDTKPIQKKSSAGQEGGNCSNDESSGNVSPKQEKSIDQALRGAGEGSELHPQIRQSMESSTGLDMGHVRVHSDNSATTATKALNAKAFTRGNEIWLGQNQSPLDKKLMAHELTHVAQQEGNNQQSIQRSLTEDSTPRQVAQEFYDALNWFNDNESAKQALTFAHEHHIVAEFKTHFQRDQGISVEQYMRNQWLDNNLVDGFALLRHGNTHDYHTAMARALIAQFIRDGEVLRLLRPRPLAARQTLELEYNTTFGMFSVGEGSLQQDIVARMSSPDKEKALMYLHRDPTDADFLYFDSAAISGTHEQQIVSRLQRIWHEGGPSGIVALKADWNRLVRNQGNWTTTGQWTDQSLQATLLQELHDFGDMLLVGSPDRRSAEYELVNAIFEGTRSYEADTADVEEGDDSEAAVGVRHRAEERARLGVAQATLRSATTGGYTGLGVDTDQAHTAVTDIRNFHQGRIREVRERLAVAQEEGDTATIAEYEQRLEEYTERWSSERERLLEDHIRPEMGTDTAGYRKSRLLLAGNLTELDSAYVASLERNHEEVVAIIDRVWAAGNIDSFREEAESPRIDDEGEVLRPELYVHLLVPVTSSFSERILHLIRADSTDRSRGANRLIVEMQYGSSGELQKVYSFLNTPGLADSLRDEVISFFVDRRLRRSQWIEEGEDATTVDDKDLFLRYLHDRYDEDPYYYTIRDWLKPATTAAEHLRRAEERYASAHSGILEYIPLNNFALLMTFYDYYSGEDTEEVTQESLARLRFISEHSDLAGDELALMMEMSGTTDVNELAGMEYEAFGQRLDEFRATRRAILDGMITAVTIAVELALSLATGGAALPMLIATITTTVGGMLIREAAMGEDYQLFSDENFQQLVIALAAHGVGSATSRLMELPADQFAALTRAQVFLRNAAEGAINEVGTQVVTGIVQQHVPSGDELLVSLISIIGTSAGAGSRSSILHNLPAGISDAASLRRHIVASIIDSMVSGNAAAGGAVVAGGDAMTADGILLQFVNANLNAIARGVSGGITSHAERRRATGHAEDAGDTNHPIVDTHEADDTGTRPPTEPESEISTPTTTVVPEPDAASSASEIQGASVGVQGRSTDEGGNGGNGGDGGNGGNGGNGGGDGGDGPNFNPLTDASDEEIAAAIDPVLDAVEAGNTTPDGESVAEGPMVAIPTGRDGEPARVLEVGSGPIRTDPGFPEEPYTIITRTDVNASFPIDRVLDGSGQVPDDMVGQFETIVINNPRGYEPNLAELGRALRPGGRIIVQGNTINPDFSSVTRQSRTPAGFTRELDYNARSQLPPGDFSGNARNILGDGFSRTTGDREVRPNRRIIYTKNAVSEPDTTPGGSSGRDGSGGSDGDSSLGSVRPDTETGDGIAGTSHLTPASEAERTTPTDDPDTPRAAIDEDRDTLEHSRLTRTTHSDLEADQEGIVAVYDIGNGHEVKVRRDGVVLSCSHCNVLRDKYQEELQANTQLDLALQRIEGIDDAELKAEAAARLDQQLSVIRTRGGIASGTSRAAQLAHDRGLPDAPPSYHWTHHHREDGTEELVLSRSRGQAMHTLPLQFDPDTYSFVPHRSVDPPTGFRWQRVGDQGIDFELVKIDPSGTRPEIEYDLARRTFVLAGTDTIYVPNLGPGERPSWRDSELFVESQLAIEGYIAQARYKDGLGDVAPNEPGHVRPDMFHSGPPPPAISVEVKNYTVTSDEGRTSLIEVLRQQSGARAEHLPAGTIQTAMIDVRGQDVSREMLIQLRTDIAAATGHEAGDIHFIVDPMISGNSGHML